MNIFQIMILATLFLAACNDENSTKQSKGDEMDLKKDTMQYGDMKAYWLVLLQNGPNRSQDSASASKIQAVHLANIGRLAKEGKIIMAGPMGDHTDLRGIFIMNCKDSLEVVTLINTDTAIVTGRLRFEIHPWWTAQGKYVFD